MAPSPFIIFGMSLAPWNLLLLLGAVLGFLVLRSTFAVAPGPVQPRWLVARYLIAVYIGVLGAQWFSYAVDEKTTILPPGDVSALRYYFHPFAGSKTLYGAILALPLAALAFGVQRQQIASAMNRLTPAMFTILGFARVGCFLAGCCYGLQSPMLGMTFPPGSAAHADHFLAGLVGARDSSLPVLPLQITEVAVCFALAIRSYRELHRGGDRVFLHAVIPYSAFRFLIEFLRADSARNYFWVFSTSQWVALAIILVVALWKWNPRYRGGGLVAHCD